MSTTTNTAPSGATVPPEVREAAHCETLSRAAMATKDALYQAANVVTQQDATIATLRAQLRAALNENAGLKRHIEAMGRGE